jgi:hypothetical protein
MKHSFDRTAPPIAAVAVVAAILTTACTAGQGAATATPESTPRASTSSAPTVAPSAAGPSSSPSASAALLTWSRASLDEDWPAPVRMEPEAATVVPILLKTVVKGTNCPGDCSYSTTGGHYVDPSGDTGSAVLPSADIQELTFCGSACLSINLASSPPPAVDPRQQWIAHGVVADTDGDGAPDWRYGIDNVPGGTTDNGRIGPGSGGVGDDPIEWYRWWRTDLHTGRTEFALGDHIVLPSGTMFYGGPERLHFGGDTTGGLVGSVPERFYAWASVIQDGRVVATDYAPDVGWLLPSPKAKA